MAAAMVQSATRPASAMRPSRASNIGAPSNQTMKRSPSSLSRRVCHAPISIRTPSRPANWTRRPFVTWYRRTLLSAALARAT